MESSNSQKELYLEDSVAVEEVLEISRKSIMKRDQDNGIQRRIPLTEELLNGMATYLKAEEWLESAGDLRLAIEDAAAWESLRLPTRLKIEIKKLLCDGMPHDQGEPISAEAAMSSPLASPPVACQAPWAAEYSSEHGCHYYFNSTTGETRWDAPPPPESPGAGGAEGLGDLSPAPAPPPPPPAGGGSPPAGTLVDAESVHENEEYVKTLLDMGFNEVDARQALKQPDIQNNLSEAVKYLVQK